MMAPSFYCSSQFPCPALLGQTSQSDTGHLATFQGVSTSLVTRYFINLPSKTAIAVFYVFYEEKDHLLQQRKPPEKGCVPISVNGKDQIKGQANRASKKNPCGVI